LEKSIHNKDRIFINKGGKIKVNFPTHKKKDINIIVRVSGKRNI